MQCSHWRYCFTHSEQEIKPYICIANKLHHVYKHHDDLPFGLLSTQLSLIAFDWQRASEATAEVLNVISL